MPGGVCEAAAAEAPLSEWTSARGELETYTPPRSDTGEGI